MCASDSVAALTIVKNPILFGEGIINDAVSILLFRSVEDLIRNSKDVVINVPDKQEPAEIENGLRMLNTQELDLGSGDVVWGLCRFGIIASLSIIIGISFGLAASFVFKNVPTLKIHAAREVFLIILVAYLSYIVSEMCNLSGIMTIFCCGMTMSYYTLYNLSHKSRKGSQLAVETIGHSAEAFLFTYMGLSLFSLEGNTISLEFSIFVLIITMVARCISIIIPYVIFVKGMRL